MPCASPRGGVCYLSNALLGAFRFILRLWNSSWTSAQRSTSSSRATYWTRYLGCARFADDRFSTDLQLRHLGVTVRALGKALSALALADEYGVVALEREIAKLPLHEQSRLVPALQCIKDRVKDGCHQSQTAHPLANPLSTSLKITMVCWPCSCTSVSLLSGCPRCRCRRKDGLTSSVHPRVVLRVVHANPWI